MKLLSADERLSEPRGAKIAIFGPTGVGKTSLLRTVSPDQLAKVLFVDIEGGDSAIAGLPVASIRPESWADVRNVAAVLGDFDRSLPPTAVYSQAHVASVSADPVLAALRDYDIIFVDSITAISRLCLRWSEQQPEATSDRGKKDLRAVYGLQARSMIGCLNQFQRARAKTIIFVGILERYVDDLNVATWRMQLEGAKTARELPGIVDQLITYQWVDRGDGKPSRTLVCTSPNVYPAKDRSGRLSQFEEPDLGALLAKLSSQQEAT